MKPYEITKQIQELESYYADCFGNNADFAQLDKIWRKIKRLNQQLLLSEIVEGFAIASPANELGADLATASKAHPLRQRIQSPGIPIRPEDEE